VACDVGRRASGAGRARFPGRPLIVDFLCGLGALVGLFLLVGAGATARLYWPGCGRRPTVALGGAVLFASGALALRVIALQTLLDAPPTLEDLRGYLMETLNGRGLLVALVAALVLVGCELLAPPRVAVERGEAPGPGRRVDRVVHAIALMTLIGAVALDTHAGAMLETAGLLPSAAEFVHLAAVLLWGGPLILLAWVKPTAAERDAWLRAMARFSRVATVAVALFAASGAVLGAVHLERAANLLSSPYGRIFDLKVGAVLLLLASAWTARRALGRGGAQGVRRLRRAMQIETLLLLLVLVVTQALASADPPHVHRPAAESGISSGER
jgi:putative copper export protein